MTTRLGTDVLIAGAGPVGLTLAMDLASRGIDVVAAEMRRRGEPAGVRCNHVSARSMEIFRRLGVVSGVRNAGLPPDFPHDVSYRTTATGLEIARIPIPSRAERYSATGGPDTWWPTPEPPHRINQIYLEPVLVDYATTMPGLRLLNRTRVLDFTEVDNGAVVTAIDMDTGETMEICCAYLVGCDGGRSNLRRQIGAALDGDPVVQRVQSTCIRSPHLLGMMGPAPSWATCVLNPRRCGSVYAIDGRQLWMIHNYLRPEETNFASVPRDQAIRFILGVGHDFTYDVVSAEDWIGRRLVADRFRRGRVFLCGDAAHIWVPMAGYGMNAGIADAASLSWLLAAVLHGWASPDILDAYEAERLPITEQVSRHAMNHAMELSKQRLAIPATIEAPGPEGDAIRSRMGKAAYELSVKQYCCGGLNFGYFYDASPIISYDGDAAPPYSMADFTPSTVPGCRSPHVWLRDGRSLYDALGPDFTLLRLNPAIDPTPFLHAAAHRGVPLKLLDVDAEGVRTLYPQGLVLVRPDQHVAWRGDLAPEDPTALIDLVRGAAGRATEQRLARTAHESATVGS
jgi:2-polyprenyl-6-methoxyphenol hydroxylase-like FAD-dependent oxidoreductase